jgi:L-seryl-tRNA(Ser) seleniumtransferase
MAKATMERPGTSDARRAVPPLDRLLGDPAVADLISLYGREPVRVQARQLLSVLRQKLTRSTTVPFDLSGELATLPAQLAAAVEAELGPPLRRILNATGVFLHTNLGRAPLPRQVAHNLAPLLDAYCDLELDHETGRRGQRNRRAEQLVKALTGAEAAVIVNNNAAALLLVLSTLAAGREVIVSRGELVEIGGSFRIPEILAASGAKLVEVGSTNRTRLSDYEKAIGPNTALLLKVFPSNFRLTGFVASVAPADLVGLGRSHGIPVLVDEGSGLLRPHPAPQLADHPSLAELVAAGVDLACGSGDKLLGGPQAGLLVGTEALLERCRRHPLYRALRPDRFCFAALEGVLRLHLTGQALPMDRLWPEEAAHMSRLRRVGEPLGAEIVAADAFLGGGSAPEVPIPGHVLAFPADDLLFARLRRGQPPIIGYMHRGRLLLDLRTVDPADDPDLVEAALRALQAR